MNSLTTSSQLPWKGWQEIVSFIPEKKVVGFIPKDEIVEFAVAHSQFKALVIDYGHLLCEDKVKFMLHKLRQNVTDAECPSIDAKLEKIARGYQSLLYDERDRSSEAYYAATLSDHIYKEKQRTFYLRDRLLNTFVDLPTLKGWRDRRDTINDCCQQDEILLGDQLHFYAEQCEWLRPLAAADPDTDITSPAAEQLRKIIDSSCVDFRECEVTVHLFFRFIDAMPVRIRAWFAFKILQSFLHYDDDMYLDAERVRIITDIIRDYKLADLPQDPYCFNDKVWRPIELLKAFLDALVVAPENTGCSTDAQGSSLRVSDSAIYKDFGQVD